MLPVGLAPALPPLAFRVVPGVALQMSVPLVLVTLVSAMAGVRVTILMLWQVVLPLQASSTRALYVLVVLAAKVGLKGLVPLLSRVPVQVAPSYHLNTPPLPSETPFAVRLVVGLEAQISVPAELVILVGPLDDVLWVAVKL